MGSDTPYFRLSFFYLIYFASLGAFVPYWGAFLATNGFSPSHIGELLAVVMATKIVSPYLWGWLADHLANRMRVIRIVAFLAALSFSFVFFRQDYLSLLVGMAVFSFFWHATLPLFEALTVAHLGIHRARYSQIRLWGSIGFIISVVGFGYWQEQFPMSVLPYLVGLLLVFVWITTLLVEDADQLLSTRRAISILPALKQPVVIVFLVACLLHQASHGAYYSFYSIYLIEHGYSPSSVGMFWALGVVSEIGIFLLVHRWLVDQDAAKLFMLSILVTLVRWLLIGKFVDSLVVLLMAQMMHAASYGLFHASAMELLSRFFPGQLQGRGQALYAGVGFGVGNALGSLVSGYVWVGMGASWAYFIASMLCMGALLLSVVVMRRSVEFALE